MYCFASFIQRCTIFLFFEWVSLYSNSCQTQGQKGTGSTFTSGKFFVLFKNNVLIAEGFLQYMWKKWSQISFYVIWLCIGKDFFRIVELVIYFESCFGCGICGNEVEVGDNAVVKDFFSIWQILRNFLIYGF